MLLDIKRYTPALPRPVASKSLSVHMISRHIGLLERWNSESVECIVFFIEFCDVSL